MLGGTKEDRDLLLNLINVFSTTQRTPFKRAKQIILELKKLNILLLERDEFTSICIGREAYKERKWKKK